jgi:hypothetical protein
MQGQSMKRMMRKAPPENSTKERFPIILQALNSHNRDPRRLNNHQNLPNKHQTQQPSKKDDVRDCSGENRVYTPLAEGQHAYVRDCQVKTHVYVLKHCQAKDKAKKLRLKMNRGCQAIRRQETQYK